MWRLILALVVFAVPTVGVAQSIVLEPLEWDFGELEVGDLATKLFLISTDDPYTPLTIGGITIEDDPFSAFDITRIDPIPPELYITDPPIEIEVTFAPPSCGLIRGHFEHRE